MARQDISSPPQSPAQSHSGQSFVGSLSQTPAQSSTAVELHALSQPLNTESPPHTPAQSSTAVPLHSFAQSTTALPPQSPAQSYPTVHSQMSISVAPY